MKFNYLFTLLFSCLLISILLSCGDDEDTPTIVCDTFTSADSVCYCNANPEELSCRNFSVSVLKSEAPELATADNGTIWTKGFVIGSSIYIIDRQSDSPHAFWRLDVDAGGDWERLADFPGNRYGITGAANGKGYASSYSSNDFWEYDPINDEWTQLADLPFFASEMHWVEYKGMFYYPDHDGIFEFNPATKEWAKISEQTSTWFGGIFLVEDDMYWYNINHNYMSHFNLTSKTFEEHMLPADFGWSVSFNSPIVINNNAFIVIGGSLWTFDNATHTWSFHEDRLTSGFCYADDVFLIDETAYIVDNGVVKVFEF